MGQRGQRGVLARQAMLVGTVLLALVVTVVTYRAEIDEIRKTAAHAAKVRADLLSQYVIMMRQNVSVLESSIVDRYLELRQTGMIAEEIERIRRFDEYGVWGLSGLAEEGGLASLSGSLTGNSVLQHPTLETKRELTAVLSVDSLFHILLENLPEVIWVYYTFQSGFIYISPDPPVADFRFSAILYTKQFWSEAEPDVNPEGRQIISELYDDAYGQGWMISLSSPVKVEGRFIGIVSLDLGVELLRQLTTIGEALGESILVDEYDQIVMRAQEFDPNERYDVIVEQGRWQRDDQGSLWLSQPLLEGELRLLHRLPLTTLYIHAAWRNSLVWVVMLTLIWLGVFSIRLNEALSRVTSLMKRDALTNLLNRRGFMEAYVPIREMARREGKTSSLLLLDIDHFKKINDTHGHDIGDQVLQGIAERLQANVRDYDLVCRWGGEEILVFLAMGDWRTFCNIAERLRLAVAQEPVTSARVRVTVSGGLTLYNDEERVERGIERADILLYRAKAMGRNRIELYKK